MWHMVTSAGSSSKRSPVASSPSTHGAATVMDGHRCCWRSPMYLHVHCGGHSCHPSGRLVGAFKPQAAAQKRVQGRGPLRGAHSAPRAIMPHWQALRVARQTCMRQWADTVARCFFEAADAVEISGNSSPGVLSGACLFNSWRCNRRPGTHAQPLPALAVPR